MPRNPLVAVAAALAAVACTSTGPQPIQRYSAGDPRPTSAHCGGLEGAEDLCDLAREFDKTAEIELAERHRAAGDPYLWLFWLARAASSEPSETVTVYVPGVAGGPSSTMTSGPIIPGPGSPEARAEIDRLLQEAASGADPALLGIDLSTCVTTAGPRKQFPIADFLAVAEQPRVSNTHRACFATEDPQVVACSRSNAIVEVEYRNIEILRDQSDAHAPFGKSVRYFILDADGFMSGSDMASTIPAMPRAMIFSNVLREGPNIPTAPVISMACPLP